MQKYGYQQWLEKTDIVNLLVGQELTLLQLISIVEGESKKIVQEGRFF